MEVKHGDTKGLGTYFRRRLVSDENERMEMIKNGADSCLSRAQPSARPITLALHDLSTQRIYNPR
jgi:hypothetical protein